MGEFISVATASVLAITLLGFTALAVVTHFLARVFNELITDESSPQNGKPVQRHQH